MSESVAIVSINDAGIIIEFNAASEELFGYQATMVLGQPLTEWLIPPQHREAHEIGFGRFLHSGNGKLLGTPRPIRLTLMKADQSEFPVNFLMTRSTDGEETIYRSQIQAA